MAMMIMSARNSHSKNNPTGQQKPTPQMSLPTEN